MSIEVGNKPSEAGLLKEKLAKLEGKAKVDFITAEKDKIAKSYWDLPTSAKMVKASDKMILLSTEQTLMEKSQTNPHAAYIEAHIEEAKRLKFKLKRLQPKDRMGQTLMLADSTRMEIKKIKIVKNNIGKQIEKLRANGSNKPSCFRPLDQHLPNKLKIF